MQNEVVFTDPVTSSVSLLVTSSAYFYVVMFLPYRGMNKPNLHPQPKSMTSSMQEGLPGENVEPCEAQAVEDVNSISESRCNILVFLPYLAFLVLILSLPRCDCTISIVDGQLTHVMEEAKIVIPTEPISLLGKEWFKIQLKATIQNSTGRCDHSLTSSIVLPKYWNNCNNGCDRPELEITALQLVQAATTCSISDIQMCPLVQNLPLDHCGSSNKTASQRQKEVIQFSTASLLLLNTTLNSSVTEKPEVLWFNPLYYAYLLFIIIRSVFNTTTLILLFIILMLILCFLINPTTNVSNSNNMANDLVPRDSPATVQFVPQPPADDDNEMAVNETSSEFFQPKESSASKDSSEGKESVLPAQSAYEQQRFAPSEPGPTETKTVHDHSREYSQLSLSLVQQSTTWDVLPQHPTEATVQDVWSQDTAEVASSHTIPTDLSSISTDSSTDGEEENSSISELESDNEDNDDIMIWGKPTVCSEESEPTDVVGLHKPYLSPPAVEMKGRMHDSHENATIEQPFQPASFFQQQEYEEDSTWLQTEDKDNQLLQENLKPTGRTIIVPGSLPIPGAAHIVC